MEDYFADIVRLKEFHKLTYTNTIKIASYLGYWVNRHKPLYYKNDPTPQDLADYPVLRDLNEWFVLNMLLSITFDQNEQYELGSEEREKFIRLMDTLHYCLVYRNIGPQAIELCLTALQTSPMSPQLTDNGDAD